MKNFRCLFVLLFFYNSATSQTKDRLPCIDKTFSIVVHIVNDSLHQPGITEAVIRSTLIGLNKEFAPICVSFDICEFKYIDNFAYNKMEEPKNWPELQTQYNVKNRINIYYVDNIIIPAGMCGFAGLGSIGALTSSGIVIKKSCALPGSKVMPHEMGHYFGLKHTFEGSGIELANGSNCATAGDEICDTPADPYVVGEPQANYVDGKCQFISMKKDANGQFYDPIVGNMMSYYPDACSCGFTDQQFMKMAKTYLTNIGMW